MFKSSDSSKKPQKRSLFRCAPGRCASTDEKDNDVYEVSNGQHDQKVTNKTVEYNVKYEDGPSHLVRKTMRVEEIRTSRSSGIDVVDNAGSSHVTKTYSMEYPSIKRSSKVTSDYGKLKGSKKFFFSYKVEIIWTVCEI